MAWNLRQFGKEDATETKAEVGLMDKNFVTEFFRAKELVRDTCAGSLATANSCLHLPDHFKFTWFDKDCAYFGDALY